MIVWLFSSIVVAWIDLCHNLHLWINMLKNKNQIKKLHENEINSACVPCCHGKRPTGLRDLTVDFVNRCVKKMIETWSHLWTWSTLHNIATCRPIFFVNGGRLPVLLEPRRHDSNKVDARWLRNGSPVSASDGRTNLVRCPSRMVMFQLRKDESNFESFNIRLD